MAFLKKYSHLLLSIYVILDFIILFSTYYISLLFFYDCEKVLKLENIVKTFILATIFFFILEKIEFTHKYRIRPYGKIVLSILLYEFILIAILGFIKFFISENLSINFVKMFILSNFIIFFTERTLVKFVLNFIRNRGFNYKNYLVIGANELSYEFYNVIKNKKEYGIKIIGFLDDEKDTSEDIKILGKINMLEDFLKYNAVDNVIIALQGNEREKIINITNLSEKYGVKSEIIPDYLTLTSKHPSVRVIDGFPLIGIRNVPLENLYNRLLKRAFDIICSLLGLIILSPLFIVVMILIKLTSKGPIFFKQLRTGYKKMDFYIYKFRTMYVNDQSDTLQATKDDPRKTVIGDFLRRTNIDELPQLINILKGEMSLVGPRPHMLKHTEEFYQIYDKYHVRHWVKPGLTGWAQVNGWRGDSDIGMRVKYDIEYIENWSFWLDIKIIFLTIFGKKVRNNAV